MSRALAFVFLSTFIIGFAAGFNIYLNNRDTLPSLPASDVSAGYTVTLDTYGACRSTGCVSFHVTHEGDVTRLVMQNGVQVSRAANTLSDDAKQELRRTLQSTTFTATRAETCTPRAEETAARVTVRIGDTVYRYDTCLAPLPEPLGSFLIKYPQWLGI
ncbi:hypothetical protein A3C87_01885 [Candidatus Kaiserbacteria bacterium RIFCSPHIGHO2_02_FULL_49_34]|uniref:Uncharacterized protein n=1 Tax=Candidatus Kaiserbacteria bacterium RIFCSPHIGHO2_02_FULL_49_34 TaxID=1798491 RepID=A0A1F6DJ38_9BACT|nr:MAG: hypothetical protein A3C87_01885 [Candidatus Kaiserbacteria bacterium RIFCSPHIGHO2_02_FULL_49_34]